MTTVRSLDVMAHGTQMGCKRYQKTLLSLCCRVCMESIYMQWNRWQQNNPHVAKKKHAFKMFKVSKTQCRGQVSFSAPVVHSVSIGAHVLDSKLLNVLCDVSIIMHIVPCIKNASEANALNYTSWELPTHLQFQLKFDEVQHVAACW